MIASDPTSSPLELRRSPAAESSFGGGEVGRCRPGDPSQRGQSGARGASENFAAHLKDSAAAMFLYASVGHVLAEADVASFRIYRDRLLADYGDPRDPILIMLVEQLALVHLNCGQLFFKASTAGSLESASAYLAAVTRLLAEFRRSALALPAYREAVQRIERGAGPAQAYQGKDTGDSELEGEDAHERMQPMGAHGAVGGVGFAARTPRKAAAGNAG